MEEMLTWLRATVEGDKALGEQATAGEWEPVVDDHGRGQVDASVWSKNIGYYITEKISSGSRHREDAAHINVHDPRDTIARCEAELELLDRCERVIANPETYDETAEELAEEVIRRLARGRRHREGFKPEWVKA